MTQADQIRQFVYKQRIVPARSAGLKEVTVRAGDIHKEMGLFSKMPSVCSVLDGRKLCDLASLAITHRRGPPNGANVFITFNLETDQAPPSCATPSSTPRRASPLPAKQREALNINQKPLWYWSHASKASSPGRCQHKISIHQRCSPVAGLSHELAVHLGSSFRPSMGWWTLMRSLHRTNIR
jgi:hypothetical protein